MNIFTKFKEILDNDQQQEYDDTDTGEIYTDPQNMQYAPQQHQQQQYYQPQGAPQFQSQSGGLNMNNAYNQQPQQSPQPQRAPQNLSVSQNSTQVMKIIKPDKFENVGEIAEHLLNRRTVVLNCEETNKETTRRIIDFLFGVTYAIDGQFKKITNTTFILTPRSVDVLGDQEPGDGKNLNIY